MSSSFSGLFGSNIKDVSPKRSSTSNTTTNVLSSTIKHSSTDDQMTSTMSTDENLLLERSKDDNRFEAYGWSLPSKDQLKLSDIDGQIQVNVPIPVYCRPMFNTNDKTQVKIEFFFQ